MSGWAVECAVYDAGTGEEFGLWGFATVPLVGEVVKGAPPFEWYQVVERRLYAGGAVVLRVKGPFQPKLGV